MHCRFCRWCPRFSSRSSGTPSKRAAATVICKAITAKNTKYSLRDMSGKCGSGSGGSPRTTDSPFTRGRGWRSRFRPRALATQIRGECNVGPSVGRGRCDDDSARCESFHSLLSHFAPLFPPPAVGCLDNGQLQCKVQDAGAPDIEYDMIEWK